MHVSHSQAKRLNSRDWSVIGYMTCYRSYKQDSIVCWRPARSSVAVVVYRAANRRVPSDVPFITALCSHNWANAVRMRITQKHGSSRLKPHLSMPVLVQKSRRLSHKKTILKSLLILGLLISMQFNSYSVPFNLINSPATLVHRSLHNTCP